MVVLLITNEGAVGKICKVHLFTDVFLFRKCKQYCNSDLFEFQRNQKERNIKMSAFKMSIENSKKYLSVCT